MGTGGKAALAQVSPLTAAWSASSAANKNAKAAQKAQLIQFWEDYGNRQKIKDQYADTKKTWQEYSAPG